MRFSLGPLVFALPVKKLALLLSLAPSPCVSVSLTVSMGIL